MRFREDVNRIMKNVQVNEDMKNQILNSTTRKAKTSRFAPKRAAIAAVAMVLCLGSVTVFAKEMKSFWNNLVDRYLVVNETEKAELVEKGYVSVPDDTVSATVDGITVSLIQTVADKNGISLYLDVKSDGKIRLRNDMAFELEMDIEGYDGKLTWSQKCLELVSETEGTVQICVEKEMSNDEEKQNRELNIDQKRVHVKLLSLIPSGWRGAEEDKVSNGVWELSFVGTGNTDSKEIILTNSIEIDGHTIQLKKMELTPFSIGFDYDAGLSENEWKKAYDDNDDEWLDKLWDLPCEVAMKDGSILKWQFLNQEGYMSYDFLRWRPSGKMIDIYNIDYVVVNGVRYDVN